MRTSWSEQGQDKAVTAPVSLIVSAFSPALDVRLSVTPQLQVDVGETRLLLVDVAAGCQRLGGSALAQVYRQIGDEVPDVERPQLLAALFSLVQELLRQNLLLAYHDRSDGGLLVTLFEMAFAGHCGLRVDASVLGEDSLAALFNEEIGAVLQVRADQLERVLAIAGRLGYPGMVPAAGSPWSLSFALAHWVRFIFGQASTRARSTQTLTSVLLPLQKPQ